MGQQSGRNFTASPFRCEGRKRGRPLHVRGNELKWLLDRSVEVVVHGCRHDASWTQCANPGPMVPRGITGTLPALSSRTCQWIYFKFVLSEPCSQVL